MLCTSLTAVEVELITDEAIRCLADLVNSDDPFPTFFEDYCRRRCPGWSYAQRENLVFAVNRLAEIEALELLDAAKVRPLAEYELDAAEAFCNHQDEAAVYLRWMEVRRAWADEYRIDVALMPTHATAYAN